MTTAASRPTIFVIDVRELRRAGVAGLLETWVHSNGYALQSLAPDAAFRAFECEPDCKMVILSIGSGSVMTRETMQRIKVIRALATEAPLVVVSDLDGPQDVLAALNAGVQGYLPTDMNPELAIHAIAFISSGGSYFPPSAIRDLEIGSGTPKQAPAGGPQATANLSPVKRSAAAERMDFDTCDSVNEAEVAEGCDQGDGGGCALMTCRQQEVLVLLREGLPNKAIARRLSMTEATVKVHVRQIMRKLGVVNRTQVAVSTLEVGMTPGGSRKMAQDQETACSLAKMPPPPPVPLADTPKFAPKIASVNSPVIMPQPSVIVRRFGAAKAGA